MDSNLTVVAHVAAVPSLVQPFCAWSDESRKVDIYLRPSVLERLATASFVAFKRVPRRGLEIGGVLLGHAECCDDTSTFWIEGFAPVQSEYRSGPSYVPSESDLGRLKDEIEKNGSASIGIFRSQTRSEQLVIQEPDAALLERYFDPADALFLMVGPVPGKAALFIRANRNLRCIHEFPLPSLSSILNGRQDLHSQEGDAPLHADPEIRSAVGRVVRRLDSPRKVDLDTLGAGSASNATVDRQEVAPLAPSPREQPLGASEKTNTESREAVKSPEPERGQTVKRGRWILAATIFALVVAAALSVLLYSIARSSAPAGSPLGYIRLGVERTGSSLTVHWDRNSPTLRGATHGVLHVQDGETQIDRILTASELKTGSVSYEPKNSEVAFGLDVYSADPHATGTVQVMNLPTQVEIQQTQPAEPRIRPQSRHTPYAPAPPLAPGARLQSVLAQPIAKTDEATDISSPVSGPAGMKQEIPIATPKPSDEIETKVLDAPDLSPKAPEKSTSPQVAIVTERAVSRNAGPSVSISAEPVSSSKLGRVVGRVPLLRRLTSHDNVEPPVPVYQAQPSLTLPNQQHLNELVLVDVKIDVAESGKVRYAEITEYGDPPNFTLANAALAAARQWTFRPARTENLPVSSQVVLHFRFNP